MSTKLPALPRSEHEAAVLLAHQRFADALAALDELDKYRAKLASELESAEAELRALARRSQR